MEDLCIHSQIESKQTFLFVFDVQVAVGLNWFLHISTYV
jgi:hypothetical protein